MPNQVCLQCVHYINRAFSFKQLCERSDSTLRQLLGLSAGATFLELKPICPSDFVVSSVPNIQEGIPDEVTSLIPVVKPEEPAKLDSASEIDGLFRKLNF